MIATHFCDASMLQMENYSTKCCKCCKCWENKCWDGCFAAIAQIVEPCTQNSLDKQGIAGCVKWILFAAAAIFLVCTVRGNCSVEPILAFSLPNGEPIAAIALLHWCTNATENQLHWCTRRRAWGGVNATLLRMVLCWDELDAWMREVLGLLKMV